MMSGAALPRGVWAIASALTPADLPGWMTSAAAADGWTFRLPVVTADHEAQQMLQQMRRHAPWLAVHAEWDWAQQCQADAVIAGSRSLPLADLVQRAQKLTVRYASQIQGRTGRMLQVGAATHSLDEFEQAQQAGADFAFVSPIWDTPSKRGILAPRGLPALKDAADLGLPVIALGGIQTAEQVAACRQHGAHAVAVLRAAQDPELLQEMRAAWADAY